MTMHADDEDTVKPLRAHVIWAHPRIDSLTAAVVGDVVDELVLTGACVDVLDLYRDDFDSVLREADEPDWNDLDKNYSLEVRYHARRAKAADIIFVIFPVWWFSLPAIMKGYIDRVWNHGLFYGGGRKAGVGRIRWIGIAGERREFFVKRSYEKMIGQHLNIGIAGFCGLTDSRVELLYNAFGAGVDNQASHYAQLRERAREVVRSTLARPSE